MSEIKIVYAGKRGNNYVFFKLDGVALAEKLIYKRKLFKTATIGLAYDCELIDSSIKFSANETGKYCDFDNRSKLVSQWRLEDSLVAKEEKDIKSIKDIHRYNDLNNFKTWFKTKSTIQRQFIVADLVTFLNN